MRLGLRMIVGLARRRRPCTIEAGPRAGPFRSLDDFARRTRLAPSGGRAAGRGRCVWLAGLDRRSALWQALAQEKSRAASPLFDDRRRRRAAACAAGDGEPAGSLADYRTAGLSLKAHPISFYRDELNRWASCRPRSWRTCRTAASCASAGLVLVRQRPGTAKGITFVTLEDETGMANLIIRQDVWERFYQVARTAAAYIAHGRLQKQEEVIHVLVTKLENLAETLQGLQSQSRDFQ